MLIAAIDKLATGHIIGNPLGLPELPGKRSFSCRGHLEGECVKVPPLVRMVQGQVLGHGVALVVGPDLHLVTLDLGLGREARLPLYLISQMLQTPV